MRNRKARSAAPFAASAAALLVLTAGAAVSPPELVSAAPDGTPGDANSYEGAVTPNGRYVVFDSAATNLLPAANNGQFQIFLLDRGTGEMELISADAAGAQGDSYSYDPCISANGRYVLFESNSSNLVANDLNNAIDVFLLDRKTGGLTLVSANGDGNPGNGESRVYGNSLSPNGRTAVFTSSATDLAEGATNENRQILLADLKKGTLRLLSTDPQGVQGNGDSRWPSMSANAKFVAFQSAASNLVANDLNSQTDAFVADVKRGTVVRASFGAEGAESDGQSFEPVVSNNGHAVAFWSSATNLVAGDDNESYDVFLADLQKGTTTRVSEGPGGAEPDGHSYGNSLTSSGKTLLFYTQATNLNPDLATPNGGVFLYDAKHGTLTQIDLGPLGEAPDDSVYSWPWSLTPTGNYALFSTESTVLTDEDTGGNYQVYVKRLR